MWKQWSFGITWKYEIRAISKLDTWRCANHINFTLPQIEYIKKRWEWVAGTAQIVMTENISLTEELFDVTWIGEMDSINHKIILLK